MASDTHSVNHTSTTSTSSFQKTVCLQNWWLVKAEKDSQGRRLAVAGFTSREQQAVRLFSSAPILKRYDVFTLETVDGICVVIKGFMDKALTEANGFTAEVIEHFVFGFPPYWEELSEKGEESTKENGTRTSAGAKKASIQSESAGESSQTSPTDSTETSENPRGEGWEKNLGEKNNPEVYRTMKSKLRSGKRKSSVLILPHDSVVGIEYPESSSHVLDNSSVPSTLDGGSEMSHALLNNMLMEHSTPSTLEGSTITPPPSADMNANIDRSHDRTTENHIVEGFTSPILACRMSKMREPNSMSKASQIRSNVRSFKYLSKQFNRDSIGKIGSLGSTPCSGRVLRSLSAVKRVKKDDKVAATALEKEKGFLVSVSMCLSDKEQAIAKIDSMSVEVGSLDLSSAGKLSSTNDTTPRKPDARPSTCNPEQNANFSYKGTNPSQGQNHVEMMTESLVQKRMNKAESASRNSTSATSREKIASGSKGYVSGNAHASGGTLKRKLAHVSEKANQQVSTTSPESVSCKRSRSGRLLLPALEFWRNQIPIYDSDRRITGVVGLHLEHPSKG